MQTRQDNNPTGGALQVVQECYATALRLGQARYKDQWLRLALSPSIYPCQQQRR